ncbi:MAG: PorT family protein [Lewinellaceae bacterium]|nr:PorT family protein [Phaeodactylibacter sp.]MCB0612546.1 PorT family protein [Phaeodactylibacter sp.]MCB9347791.1 PorT family protein [Lewinellaceae bacterium]
MNRLSLLLLLTVLGFFQLTAQEFSGGFRAGINFATISGPLEVSDSGNDLEEYKMSTGFHVGATANLKFNDYFGLRAELLYSQKGADYNYNGQSFWILYTEDDQPIYATGSRTTSLSITNSYIDIPFMAVGRLGRVELSGGFNLGILVSSRGSGELTFSGQTDSGFDVDPFTVALDFSYFDDTFRRTDIDDVEIRDIGGKTVVIPKTLTTNFQELEGKQNLFNTLDLGLIGGLAFYLNQGLYVGLRVNYGLSDLTKTEQDPSRKELDDTNNLIFREDKDHNLTLQASVGFSF